VDKAGDKPVISPSSGKRRTAAVLRLCAAPNHRCPPLLELEEDDPEVAGDERVPPTELTCTPWQPAGPSMATMADA
jgi:hypothetical protein